MYKTIQEISEIFNVHYNTVRNWIKQGVPCLRSNGLYRFKVEDVEIWLKGR